MNDFSKLKFVKSEKVLTKSTLEIRYETKIINESINQKISRFKGKYKKLRRKFRISNEQEKQYCNFSNLN